MKQRECNVSNEIPASSRQIVKARARGRCERCNGVGAEWHHRRTRSVRDDHRHCPCNGVLLCSGCHQWVHAHPFEARQAGWIVSRHTVQPGLHPVHTLWGVRWHDCDGDTTYERVLT